jgi:23S rRNA pseudouridine1911/1915/1917 synthase
MDVARFEVKRGERGMALIDFLAKKLELSKRKSKGLLDRKLVAVNGEKIWMAQHNLMQADVVEVSLAGARAAHQRPRNFKILYKDAHIIVADKPAGMLSAGKGSWCTPLRKQLKFDMLEPAHRLDKDTSGCQLFARSPEALDAMMAQFGRREIVKVYHAIVLGRIEEDSLTLTTAVRGQPAKSAIRVLDSNRQASHVVVRIHTGRTHQIRVHMSRMGHPVIGDTHYGADIERSQLLDQVERHMLHASTVQMPHPITGENLRVISPLPADFNRWLKRLKLS